MRRQTVEQLVEGYHHLATTQRAVRRQRMASAQAPRMRAETADSIQTTLELMDQTDDAQALGAQDAAGDQVQDKFLRADADGVPGVRPALETHDDAEVLAILKT